MDSKQTRTVLITIFVVLALLLISPFLLSFREPAFLNICPAAQGFFEKMDDEM